MRRLQIIKHRLFWLHYERFEWTRLQGIRNQMMTHKTFKKEDVLSDFAKTKKESKEHYVWSYIIRPVRNAD